MTASGRRLFYLWNGWRENIDGRDSGLSDYFEPRQSMEDVRLARERRGAQASDVGDLPRLMESLVQSGNDPAALREHVSRLQQAVDALTRKASDSGKRAEKLAIDNNDLRATLQRRMKDIEQLRAQHAKDLRAVRLAKMNADQRAEKIHNTITWRLGKTILDSKSSLGAALKLPKNLYLLYKDTRSRRGSGEPVQQLPATLENAVTKAVDLYNHRGLLATLQFLEGLENLSPAQRSSIYTDVAKELFAGHPMDGVEIAKSAVELDPKPYRMKWLAFKLWEAGFVTESHTWLERALRDKKLTMKASEAARARDIEGAFEVLASGLPIEAPAVARQATASNRIAYVVASAEPFNTSGYTSRSESAIKSLKDAGCEIEAFLRPGYPFDRADAQEIPRRSQLYAKRRDASHLAAKNFTRPGVPPADRKGGRGADGAIHQIQAVGRAGVLGSPQRLARAHRGAASWRAFHL
jgi:hypothetical protein